MILSVLVAGLLSSTSATTAAEGENAAAAAKPVKEKKVCKLEDGETTSRMRRRVCRAVKERNEASESDVSVQRPGMRSH